MRIGIDGTTICDATGGRGAGIEHYTWSILFAMAKAAPTHEFVVAVPSHFSPISQRSFSSLKNIRFIRPMLVRVPFFSRHVGIPTRMRFAGVDVLFAPAGQVPLGWRGKSVVVVHDLSIYAHPEWFPDEKAKNFSTKVVVPRSMQRAEKIIAVSEFTKSQIKQFFPEVEDNIHVVAEGVWVPEGVSQKDFGEYCAPDHHIADDVVLSISTLEPRKNLEVAIHAFDRFLTMHPDRAKTTRYVIAGKQGWKAEGIQNAIQDVNTKWRDVARDGVALPFGYVSEEEKWHLLHQASVLLFPSWEEGFGLPILEAQAVGTPVIAGARGALPEVGGDAALYVEPDDIEGMALAIAQCILLPEAVRSLSEEGKRHAAKFTWSRAAKETLKVIEAA